MILAPTVAQCQPESNSRARSIIIFRRNRMKKLLKEFRLEIAILLAAIILLILAVGDFGVRAWVGRAAQTSISATKVILQSGWAKIDSLLLNFSPVDLASLLLAGLAFVFVGWRVRERLLQSEYWLSAACPRCEGKLERIHRSTLDRWLTRRLLAYGRRYKCTNCGWSGLLHRREQLHRG